MDNSLILGTILGNILIFLVLIGAYGSRVKRVGPNHALIVYGRGGPRAGGSTNMRSIARVVVGGRTFVFPFLEKAVILSLEPARAEFKWDNIITGDGKRISVTGKVQYKVSYEYIAIMKAAQHFLSKREAERTASVMDMIESNFRRVVEESSQEEIEQSPMRFGDRVIEAGRPEMEKMGIEVMSLVITGV